MDDISTDQILADVNSQNAAAVTPAEAAPATSEGGATAPTAAQQAAWLEDEYEIEGGRKVKEPREMILKRAGLGYHAAQKLHAVNQQEQKYKQMEETNKKLARWQEFHDYAEKNPQWWQHVEASWNGKGAAENPAGQEPLNPVISELQKRVEAYESRLSQYDKHLESQKHEVEDKHFREEITGVEKQFGVDLWQADEQGKSLQWRVLEHMEALGLDGTKKGHFTAAFKDYYFDNLVGREKESAKEAHAKQQAELKKAGILGVSRTPKQPGNAFNGNAKDYSWDKLGEMIMADVRAGKTA